MGAARGVPRSRPQPQPRGAGTRGGCWTSNRCLGAAAAPGAAPAVAQVWGEKSPVWGSSMGDFTPGISRTSRLGSVPVAATLTPRRASSRARGLANNARGGTTGRRLPCPWVGTKPPASALHKPGSLLHPPLPKALALSPRQRRAGRRGAAAARPRRSLTGRSGCAVSSDPHKLFLAPRRAAGSPGWLRAARLPRGAAAVCPCPRRLSVSLEGPWQAAGAAPRAGPARSQLSPCWVRSQGRGAPVLLAAAARVPGGGRGGGLLLACTCGAGPASAARGAS